jgi:crotonobetainyl-CoA:carnitine CoA-transferase CaiB-like acyl-CoA transferase
VEQLEKSGPLKGIKVVEIGMWAAGPAAGAIFTDWGADVIKVEPLEGDPYRALVVQRDNEGQDSPQFRLDNRAKRSVTLDVRTDEGRQLAYELIKRSDVFLTNIRLQGLERFKMTWDILKEINPRLIYTIVTGYGIKGAEINRPAFDSGAWWGRGGVAATVLPDGIPPLFLAGGIGDHFTAMAAVTGTCAALYAREQTGKGQLVDVSMLRTAAYFISFNLFDQMLGRPRKKQQRHETLNPMIIPYQVKGGKWFSLLGLQGDRVWPLVMRAVDRPDLIEDERFNTAAKRAKNSAELVKLLDEIFATRTLAEWAPRLDREDVWWAPTQTTEDLLTDPQVRAAGVFMEVPAQDGKKVEMVASPVDYSGTPWRATGTHPALGQHTEEVLLELGRDWEEIARLKEKKVIG